MYEIVEEGEERDSGVKAKRQQDSKTTKTHEHTQAHTST